MVAFQLPKAVTANQEEVLDRWFPTRSCLRLAEQRVVRTVGVLPPPLRLCSPVWDASRSPPLCPHQPPAAL